MLRRRHQSKSKGWLTRKYWTASGRKHVFSVISNYKGKKHLLKVVRIGSIGIRRHIKIKADANPYMPECAKYFWRRRHYKETRLLGALSARAYRAMRA
jgi:RNA-directed DNA polymerase